jgi:hypothetical protein
MLTRFCLVGCLVAATAGTASAQQNLYGGYDIVAFAGNESFYASARNLNVFSGWGPAGFGYCFAEGVRDNAAYRLGWDGLQWQLAVPITSSPDWQGVLQIDGQGSGRGYLSGGENISGTAVGGWSIAWLGGAELDGISKGSVAVLGVGRGDFDFSLSGSAAAILKVEECVARQGSSEAVLTPQPSESEIREFARSGDWVINELRADGQVYACEAIDTVLPTLRFEIDMFNSYVDFSDNGPMGGPGATPRVMVGFGPGDAPQPYEVNIIEGRDGRAWGRITEGRMDGPGLMDDSFQNSTQVSFQGPNIILERPLFGSKAALDAFFRCSQGIR